MALRYVYVGRKNKNSLSWKICQQMAVEIEKSKVLPLSSYRSISSLATAITIWHSNGSWARAHCFNRVNTIWSMPKLPVTIWCQSRCNAWAAKRLQFLSVRLSQWLYLWSRFRFGMISFNTFYNLNRSRHNSIRSKPWEALWGCIVPLLSLLSAVGLLSAIGLKFQSIVVATLFLVLAVGVDDVFIIMRAWDRTDHRRTVPERLSATLEDAGPSITISSLTNAMSFAIGITSSTPAVQTFCIYSTVSIVICYFYQLILFTAILALSGIREESGRQSLLCCFKVEPQVFK